MSDVRESARPCGCDIGAKHICEWHASHGLSLEPPVRSEIVLTQTQREHAEQIRVQRQKNPFARTPEGDINWKIANPSLAAALLPTDPKVRKSYPIGTGVLDYFPLALAEIARVSLQGNEQHNPGEPLHWAREKSGDQSDTLIRHFLERGTLDTDGMRHSAKMAWRALALLQLEMEEAR